MEDVRCLTVGAKRGRHFTIEVTKIRSLVKYLPVLSLFRQQGMTPPTTLRDVNGLALTDIPGVLITCGVKNNVGRPTLGHRSIDDIGPFMTIQLGVLDGEDCTIIAVSLIDLSTLKTQFLDGGTEVIWVIDAGRKGSSRLIDISPNGRIYWSSGLRIFVYNDGNGFAVTLHCRVFVAEPNDAAVRKRLFQPHPCRFCRSKIEARKHPGPRPGPPPP